MIPKDCKRLAEVDFPIAEVSRHALQEKHTRSSHPSTLHIWWARRPLASSRAMLIALLLPDPCDPRCPQEFKEQARELFLEMRERPTRWASEVQNDEGLRKVLLKFTADFASWGNSTNAEYIETSRRLIEAAHSEGKPLVVDPFAGGGSIPLEALRLGCESFASDLNPVSCFVLKTTLESIARNKTNLADEVRRVGKEIQKRVEREIAVFYPKGSDETNPVAYIWARTVRCEAPNCGAEIPIYSSPWLSKKGSSSARHFRETENGSCVALIVKDAPLGGPIEFRLARGEGRENPTTGFVAMQGTKAGGNNANVICPCCKAVLPGSKKNPRVPSQLKEQRGGTDVTFDAQGQRIGGARLLAVISIGGGKDGRKFRLPTTSDYEAVLRAQERISNTILAWQENDRSGPCPVPDEPMPPVGTLGFRVQRYGMLQWGDLFTARQKLVLTELARAIRESDASPACRELLACALNVFARACNSSARLRPDSSVAPAFGMNALSMNWAFPETVIAGGRSENFDGSLNNIAEIIERYPTLSAGIVQQADAAEHPLPSQSTSVWFTDPPYYDSVPYADLSDFFLAWLKRSLTNNQLLQDPFDPENPLSPKTKEIVQDKTKLSGGKPKGKEWFENAITQAFKEGRRLLSDDGIGAVVFAHKTTEAWEALLSGMIKGGWTITGSWPIATESAARLRARDSAALATSVHLICRPRPEEAPIGEWGQVLQELPVKVGNWMQQLEGEGIRGADLVFACVGPALEIFSRFSRVETADGHEIQLAEYLERVWEVVGREALKQVLGTAEAQARNGAAGALEEDARLTALFLWTLQTAEEGTSSDNSPPDGEDEDDEDEETPQRRSVTYSLLFDVARRFAQPLGIHLEEWENRIIHTDKGVVRLRPVVDRARELFGEAGAESMADEIESNAASSGQLTLFPDEAPTIRGRARRGRQASVTQADDPESRRDATTLDRVHAAMLLQASGRTEALRNLLRAEHDRSPDFLRLSNALSALYPRGSEEKRLLDGMLVAAPR